jgi:hypothetical protein
MTNSSAGPRTLRATTAALFDQQCWCWGRDIARPAGNVLLGLGMCRHRAPARGSSLYTARTPAGGVVWLWAFGTALTDPAAGTVYVGRYGFAPRLTRRADFVGVHDPADLGRLARPTTAREWQTARRLLADLARWAAGYEHWVAETLGTDYRAASLSARSKPPVVPARDMAAAWERLAKRVRLLNAPPTAATGPWAVAIGRLRAAG